MKILAIIPARAGSKGIPNKNIRIIGGYPLIHYSINNAMNSKRGCCNNRFSRSKNYCAADGSKM